MSRFVSYLACLSLLIGCTRPSGPGEIPAPSPLPKPEEPVKLSDAIAEGFDGEMSSLLQCNVRTTRDDFRYYPGFPSISERGSEVMLMRIDPLDAAGIQRGPSVSSVDKCHYGTYSARFRVPNTIKAQGDLGVCASFGVSDGESSVTLEIRLSDPQAIYLISDKETVVRPQGFNANSRFYIYGFDWSENSVTWWLQTSASGEKTVIATTEAAALNVPAVFSFNYYYSKLKPVENRPNSVQAPAYAYEIELDSLNYTPSVQDE